MTLECDTPQHNGEEMLQGNRFQPLELDNEPLAVGLQCESQYIAYRVS